MSKRTNPARLAALCCALVALPAFGAQPALSGDAIATNAGDLIVHPIRHATFEMAWNGRIVAMDPVGGAALFAGLPRADLILITHAHPDHFNVATLRAVAAPAVRLVVPAIVARQLPDDLAARAKVLANGETTRIDGIEIVAVAAYNTTPARLKFHPKGVGNGYVLTMADKRIYVSGDTEDIPQMRALRNIDVAFVCMNLPYTMTVEQAADAVRAFRPAIVYPYHYRGSDVARFKALVGSDAGVEVRVRDWYPRVPHE